MKESNRAAYFLQEYLDMKMLAEMGFNIDYAELTDVEVEIYRVITNKLNELQEAELKRKKK